jgi:predicted Zn-dependent protease
MRGSGRYGNAGGFEFVKSWDMPKYHREDKSLQKNLKEGKKLPQAEDGRCCPPQVVGILLHEPAGHPYEADRIFGREAARRRVIHNSRDYGTNRKLCCNVAMIPPIETLTATIMLTTRE